MDDGRQPTIERQAIPTLPAQGRVSDGRGEPEFLELRFQEIDGCQGGIVGKQLIKFDGLLFPEIIPVAQQQPATALDHPTGYRLLAQAVGLIDTDAVHDLPAKAGDDVEEVIDDLGIRAALPYLQIEGGIHVHGDRLDLLPAVLAEQFEKGRIASRLLPSPTQRTHIRCASITTVA